MLRAFDSFRFVVTFLAISFLQGCTAIKAPDITPKQADQYKYHREIDNLNIIVDPLFDSQNNEDLFGINLLRFGVLPVYIIIENNCRATYLFEKKQIALLNNSSKSSTQDKDLYLMIMPRSASEIVLDVLIWGVIGLLDGPANKSARERVMQNMRKCELPDQTISPGQQVYGFVYFPVGKESSLLSEPVQLLIPLKNVRDKTSKSIVIELYK